MVILYMNNPFPAEKLMVHSGYVAMANSNGYNDCIVDNGSVMFILQ